MSTVRSARCADWTPQRGVPTNCRQQLSWRALPVRKNFSNRRCKVIDTRTGHDDAVTAAVSFLSDPQELPALIFPELYIEVLALNLQFSRLDDVIHFALTPPSLGSGTLKWKQNSQVFLRFLKRDKQRFSLPIPPTVLAERVPGADGRVELSINIISERQETNSGVLNAGIDVQAQKRVLPFRRVAARVAAVRRWAYCVSHLQESKRGQQKRDENADPPQRRIPDRSSYPRGLFSI